MAWYDSAVFYHIYPLGFCGCERHNDYDAPAISRINKIGDFAAYIKSLNMNSVYLGPVMSSTGHGYDTADYLTLDRRLGTNADFKAVVDKLHNNGLRVVLDGVFNHVGRDFWAFRDLRENGLGSRYRDWFHAREGNSNYNDGFYYDGWEGHFELVKLNLHNPAVREYLLSVVGSWIDEFDIDGLRLDVAYLLNHDFLRELRQYCDQKKLDFWLMGETLHGDYNTWLNPSMLHSVTNYECYKGLYSSFNERNMFEIAYSLNRQFGAENWTLYKGRRLYCFLDNHDVSRIASILKDKRHLPLIYTLLFTMPGIPSVYYGSEWGLIGDKRDGDDALRPEMTAPVENELSAAVAALAKIHSEDAALHSGTYAQLHLTNCQFIFERSFEGRRVIIAINIADEEYAAHFGANAGRGTELLTGGKIDFGGGLRLPPCSALVIGDLE